MKNNILRAAGYKYYVRIPNTPTLLYFRTLRTARMSAKRKEDAKKHKCLPLCDLRAGRASIRNLVGWG